MASQRKVASVSPCDAISAVVSTSNVNSTPRPAKATIVTLRFSLSAKTQPKTISTKATAVILSWRDSGPSVASALRASTGASGVLPTLGGNRRAITQGNAAIAAIDGTHAATSHFPNP